MFLTEIQAAKQVRDGELPSPYKFTNMWLINLRITGTGMAWRTNYQEHVWRSPSLYLNPQFLERCNGVPVIINHPEDNELSKVGTEYRIVGTVMLPYIKGDEVWAVCRIYGDAVVELILKEKVSTSPNVVFCQGSGTVDVPDAAGDDKNLSIEGTPYLIDHLALVPLGVWDKDGEPAGVEVTEPTEEMKLTAIVKNAVDEAFRPTMENLEKISSRLDEMEKITAV
ncbi:cell envelope biogenesis protein TolA [Enterobacter mori]|uniref:cell envelope biogenesis protein TolA n=1 Tax=Enterobacter mori TaxID=539813 RepID=UPI003B83B581